MFRFTLAVFAVVCGIADGAKTQPLRHKEVSFLSELKFSQKLRVCNGYYSRGSLQLFVGKTEMQGKYPLAFNECRDYADAVKEGDRISFKAGDLNVGTFTLSGLPENDATLLLVIYQQGRGTVAFKSHTFAPTSQAQVAVLDAYDGPSFGEPVIMDVDDGSTGTPQALAYDTAMAISQGSYQVALHTKAGSKQKSAPFNIVNGKAYVILRTGAEGSFDQDVVVFPKDVPPLAKIKRYDSHDLQP